MNYTSNYQLNQWDEADRVQRTDFNADNAKIDAALGDLAGRARFAAGHYAGNGAETCLISTGFTPKAVLVLQLPGILYTAGNGFASNAVHGGLAVTDHPAGYDTQPSVKIVDGGFQVFYTPKTSPAMVTNANNEKYNYIAFG